MRLCSVTLMALGLLSAGPSDAAACTIVVWPVPSPLSIAQQLTIDAEVIVRATAMEYAQRPADPRMYTTGVPDAVVRFRIDEVLKGASLPKALTIPGYLSDVDDFNDHPAPYHFVRPNGRSGSCVANSYRRGAPFLLMLKKDSGGYTPYWGALEPVNEQLRSEHDEWITWVRNQIYEDRRSSPRLEAGRLDLTYRVYAAVIDGLRSGAVAVGAALPATLDIFGRTTLPVDRKPYREPGSPLPVSRELQADFADSVILQDPILPTLAVGSPYRVVPVTSHGDYRQSPGRSLLTFSQVGVDRAATTALVYFSYQCARDCGMGGYVILERRSGDWRIVRVIDAWKVAAGRP